MAWTRYLRRNRWDAERAREVQEYIEAETADNIARGMPPAEARLAARRKLGSPTLIREEIYRMNTIGIIDGLWQDVRYAFRVLRKSPAFAAVAILSLALGIGANTAVFSVVRAVLLRPLPYPHPEQLMLLSGSSSRYGATMPEFEFWKEHARSFSSATAIRGLVPTSLADGDRREAIAVLLVSTDFFRTLGMAPGHGREFDAAETRPGGPGAIILSDGLWRRAFNADPGVAGRVVRLGGAGATVTGVAPAGFWFEQNADAFVPLRNNGSAGDLGANTGVIVRLRPGITPAQANGEMAALTENFRRSHPDETEGKYTGLSLAPYHDSLVGDVKLNLLLLLGAVGLLLLIACSNLASLVLARLAARQEIALRLALGSGRARLLRQFLIENLLLTGVGGAAGLAGARLLLDALLAVVPFRMPSATPIQPDAPVLAFTLAVALVTGLLFSLAPIHNARRADLQETLKAGGRATGTSRQTTRHFLVGGEVAVSVTLLVAAGLLIESLYRIHREHLGFNPRGVITFSTARPPGSRGKPGFTPFQPLLERLRTVPGVRFAAAVNILPLTGQHNYPAQEEGRPDHTIGGMEYFVATPDYLAAMGTPVVRGRGLAAQDTENAPPVVLVSEEVARRWWPNENPLGHRVVWGLLKGKPAEGFADVPREVVGIVADTKGPFFKDPPRPTIYMPAAQVSWYDQGMDWVVRADLSPGMAGRLRLAVADFDPRLRVDDMRTMEDVVASTTADSRFDAWLFGAFAAIALVLTTVGVYGLLSFSVAQRTAEIGTRMALGASRADVLRMVLRQGVTLVATGLVCGLAGALLLTRSLEQLLFGVKPTDPLSFAAVAVLLLAVGLAASYFPARRATKVDPIVALRYE